ncbi:MAG: apolipoprotein N-acyltransferase [Pseudomonadota bacterium]
MTETVGEKAAFRKVALVLPLAHAAAIVCLGALTVLTLPPFSFLILAPATYGALFVILRGLRPFRAAVTGWAFGLGYFAGGIFWIAESFFVDADRFGLLAIPAVAGLSALLAFFPALASFVFAVLARSRLSEGLAGPLLFATCWTAAEWLRGHVLTGFPWNLSGYALVEYEPLRQPAAWIGRYGLGFLFVFLVVLPAHLIASRNSIRPWGIVLTLGFAASLWGAGQTRLWLGIEEPTNITVRIVQGNVPQQDKWRPELREETVSRYIDLSSQGDVPDIVLWPETAYPGFLDEVEADRQRIMRALPQSSILMTGVPDRVASGANTLYFNTVQAYDTKGRSLGGYAKHKLVPFGEYVPFREWLPFERLTKSLGDFTPGPGPRTLALPGIPFVGIAICYEIIFPGHVVDDAIRPDWIFNATNDAWFGTSIGPEQHMAAARMRAVEEGLPVLRAANTGISAVIDARGRVLASLGLEQTGVLDLLLPPALPRTLYARFGDWTLLPLVLACWFLFVGLRVIPSLTMRFFSHLERRLT